MYNHMNVKIDKTICVELCFQCSLYGDTNQAEDTLFLYNDATALQWAKASSLSRIHDHTQVDIPHIVGISVQVISPMQWPLPDNTQHSQEIDIYAPGGIRTHNPRKWAAAEPRFRPAANGIGRLRCWYYSWFTYLCKQLLVFFFLGNIISAWSRII